MKLGPVTKLGKSNTAALKNLDDDVMSANCEVIVFFSIYCQFAAIPKRNSGRIIYKTSIFIKGNFLSYKN